ncbi:MAG: TolC family protein, partial [Bacteroidota bacterium]
GIDTSEAASQVQTLEISYSDAEVSWRNASVSLSVYLWSDEARPLELAPNVIPEEDPVTAGKVSAEHYQNLLVHSRERHPDLLSLNLKSELLRNDRKLYYEKLKPKLNLHGYFLNEGFASPIETEGGMGTAFNSAKAGFTVSMPLLLREGRGKIQLNTLKIRENELSQMQQRREIAAGVERAYNDLLALEKQLASQEKLVSNYDKLLRGEQRKFEVGESSIFLVNTRQNNVVSGQVKLYELKAKYAKAKVTLQWSAGKIELI